MRLFRRDHAFWLPTRRRRSIAAASGWVTDLTGKCDAARRAEYDYYSRNNMIGADRFIPTPDSVIRAMLEGALAGTRAHGHDTIRYSSYFAHT